MTDKTQSASKVIAGDTAKKTRTMFVDENNVDIEQMQSIIQEQSDMIADLSAIVEARDAEDAEITRNLIVSKTKDWKSPFTYDELVEFSKDELDDLHMFVCRVGRRDLTDQESTKDEAPKYDKVRRFPKLSGRDDAGNYQTANHVFKL